MIRDYSESEGSELDPQSHLYTDFAAHRLKLSFLPQIRNLEKSRMASPHQFVAYIELQVISTDHHSHGNCAIRRRETALQGPHFWQGLYTTVWVGRGLAG